jgi:exopolyphosphatase/guanosine-5'-triphosphate,3'-diphosphate pyrophosphatase
MPPATPSPPRLIGVLDMGASAVRLIVGELTAGQPVRVLEDAVRAVPLGRDVFSTGVITAGTVDRTLSALEGFRKLLHELGVTEVRAVATSATREARNADMFLDRIRNRTGLRFEVINEAEESRFVHQAVRHLLRRHPAFKGTRTLVVEVGGGNTDLTLLRQGEPNRSGVYALGAVRMRQQFDMRRLAPDVQVAILKRYIANVVSDIREEIPLRRVTHFIAIGGDVRFAASEVATEQPLTGAREIARDDFIAFCDLLAGLDDDTIAERYRLSATAAQAVVPSLLVYRTILAETSARRVIVSDASLRLGVLLDMAEPGGRLRTENFEQQVLASAEALGHKYRFDEAHGRQVATLATALFDALRDEHGLDDRERLLLQVASLLHDIGTFVSLRAHHKHSQNLLAASQIFGLSHTETAIVGNIARYHRRGLPQQTHLPYIALDAPDRLIVNKLAAIMRIANALDAEHLAKIGRLELKRDGEVWTLDLESTADLTLERIAAAARADMFVETYGRQLLIRQRGVGS